MSSAAIQRYLYNMRTAVRELDRNAKKSEAIEQVQREKTMNAIMSCNVDVGRIYAENAIRQRHLSNSYRRISERIVALAACVKEAQARRRITATAAAAVRAIDAAIRSMDLASISILMAEFAKKFGQKYGLSSTPDTEPDLTGPATMISVPAIETDRLLLNIADDAGLRVTMTLPSGLKSHVPPVPGANEEQVINNRWEREEHLKRLDSLRQSLADEEKRLEF